MDSTVDLATFDSAHENRSASWMIDQNHPAIVALERADRLGVAIGEPADTAAWLARIRRL